jgi:hypothetical protein
VAKAVGKCFAANWNLPKVKRQKPILLSAESAFVSVKTVLLLHITIHFPFSILAKSKNSDLEA